MENIELHIEELILEGFAPGDRYRIGEAMEHELTRLFSDQGAPSLFVQSGEFGRLDGGAFHVAPGTNAEAVGKQVAKAVYEGSRKWE